MKRFPHYERFVPEYLRSKWDNRFWVAAIVEAIGYLFMPLICLFTRQEMRVDRMKRRAREWGDPSYTQYEAMRDYLPKWLNWFQTHDNAMDEYWYGDFKDSINSKYSQTDYDKSWLLRYYNRVKWGWRNNTYGFQYFTLGVAEEDSPYKSFEEGTEDSGKLWVKIDVYANYFQYECQIPNGKGGYKHYNFGWKAHRSAPILAETGRKNVMYANRIITNTRKYKD
jgi:hypothetical protein